MNHIINNIQAIFFFILGLVYVIKEVVDFFEKRNPDSDKIERIEKDVKKAVLIVEQIVRKSMGDNISLEQKQSLKKTAIDYSKKMLDNKAIDFIKSKLYKIRGLDCGEEKFLDIYIGETIEYIISEMKHK